MADSKDEAVKTPSVEPSTTAPPEPASTASAAATEKAVAHENDAPDPDEDDLDDLDDMLDEFSTSHNVPPPASSGPAQPTTTTKAVDPSTAVPEDAEDFAAQLQKEMAALMSNPDMQTQMEAMMAELAGGADETAASASKQPSTNSASAEKPKAGPSGDDAFSETIRKTMERMQASSTSASEAATSSANAEDDMLAALMKELAASGGDGEGSEEDFSKMLLGMMEQLTNKEILYEPMKDLNTRFPDWMKDHEGKVGTSGGVSQEDWTRYQEQRRLVGEIVGRFERNGYSDENPSDREYIVERMQQMQAQGQPPNDLVGDMKETQEALGDIDAGCPQQ